MVKLKTIIVGLGNPLFRDDNAGIYIIRKLASYISRPDISFIEAYASGLDILDMIAEYEKAIIIDAVQTNRGKAGQIHKISPETVQTTRNMFTSHSLDLLGAIELGKRLGQPLPRDIVIFGIEVRDISIPDGKLTPEIEDAIPVCLNRVLREISFPQEECNGDQSYSCCR